MENEQKEERSEEAVAEMYEAIKAYVKSVEAETPLTQNHYGAYMGLLGLIKGVENQRGMAKAMIKVGGNTRGLSDGFKAATGEFL